MKKFMQCRRTFVGVVAIVCLTALGVAVNADVSMAIASVAIGIAGSNAAQGILARKEES